MYVGTVCRHAARHLSGWCVSIFAISRGQENKDGGTHKRDLRQVCTCRSSNGRTGGFLERHDI